MRKILTSLLFTLVAVPALAGAAPAAEPNPAKLRLASAQAMVVDAVTGEPLYSKNAGRTVPIASITKLMTAMVVLDARLPMDETLTVADADVDKVKHAASRIRVGTRMTRREMLHLALMSSENRAASALSRHYPGGREAFVHAMREKAKSLGMKDTHFDDPTGLSPSNVSTAEDLVKMVSAASHYPMIKQFTTTAEKEEYLPRYRAPLTFRNTNVLVRGGEWNISVSKTGFTDEAGHCLVMMAKVASRPLVMVLLESDGKLSPAGDATRIKNWLEKYGKGYHGPSKDDDEDREVAGL